jgi:hypothetical protein
VGNEIIEGKLQPATWALALAYSNGSRDQAMTHYARLRLESLADQSTETKLKEQALEARRKAGFRKMTVPLPRLYLGNLTPAGMRNRRRISLSPVWLAGLWLSGTAACAAISRFYSESFYDPSSRISVSGSIGIIALLLMAIIMLHLLIPKTRLLIRYAIPMGAWTAACTSCYFGLMILKSNNSGNLTDRGSYEKTILPEETSQNGPARKHDATKSVAQTR